MLNNIISRRLSISERPSYRGHKQLSKLQFMTGASGWQPVLLLTLLALQACDWTGERNHAL